MTLLVRMRIAVIDWWLRASMVRRAPVAWDDLEGMGRRLACPPLRKGALRPEQPTTALAKATRRAAPRIAVSRRDV
jgi:hypothetical protein